MEQKTMTIAKYRSSVRRASRVIVSTANFAIDQSGQVKRRTMKISKRAAIGLLDSVCPGSTIMAQWADDDERCLMVGV